MECGLRRGLIGPVNAEFCASSASRHAALGFILLPVVHT
jgi:hypothetical protein